MNVYLIRIHDRPYGFRIVAYVSRSRELAMQQVALKYNCNFERSNKRHYATISNLCAAEDGCSCDLIYEE